MKLRYPFMIILVAGWWLVSNSNSAYQDCMSKGVYSSDTCYLYTR